MQFNQPKHAAFAHTEFDWELLVQPLASSSPSIDARRTLAQGFFQIFSGGWTSTSYLHGTTPVRFAIYPWVATVIQG